MRTNTTSRRRNDVSMKVGIEIENDHDEDDVLQVKCRT